MRGRSKKRERDRERDQGGLKLRIKRDEREEKEAKARQGKARERELRERAFLALRADEVECGVACLRRKVEQTPINDEYDLGDGEESKIDGERSISRI